MDLSPEDEEVLCDVCEMPLDECVCEEFDEADDPGEFED